MGDLANDSHVYTVDDVRIDFPYMAYKSQRKMISKIIEGVKSGQNCLLESPTGTGKTAALLCALLGWVKDCRQRNDYCTNVIDRQANDLMGGCQCGEVSEESVEDSESKPDVSPCKKTKWSNGEGIKAKQLSEVCDYCAKKFGYDRDRPPRIIYCTRTLSQIAQVVKQLKATAYKDTPMTILAGRESTCLNRNTFNRRTNPEGISLDDECSTLRQNYRRRLLKNQEMDPDAKADPTTGKALPPICKYFRPKSELYEEFEDLQAEGAFDIEDLTKKGLDCTMCPYYGSSALMNTSDIVFATYNYLLDPEIRASKDIPYRNSVLVFDEAHNIEDICRSMFSFKVDCEHLDTKMIPMVEHLLSVATQKDSQVNSTTLAGLLKISELFRNWSNKIKEYGNGLNTGSHSVKTNDEVRKDFLGSSLSQMLIDIKMTENAISEALEDFERKKRAEEEEEYYFERDIKRPFQVSARILSYLKEIRHTLMDMDHKERDGVGGLKDFSGHVTRRVNPGRSPTPVLAQAATSKQPPGPAEQGPEFFFKFEIICLNPAVGFRTLKNMAYSIIVASGTLTPLNSFASELATNFGVQLQAEHVIPKENVWTGVITTGPSQTSLKLVKELQDDITVQDDLGKILVEVCHTVPNGVLVFFPSYTLMGKLLDRWREYPKGHRGSVLGQITSKKYFFQEESKDKQAFKLKMERYKQLVKGDGTKNGCILFAVFRGKISEGIDFADEQARAVVTIGIPYSNSGAMDISAKREYNDGKKRANKGDQFLSGLEWYTTQAFRALNQGLGRCVRHCKDWGALILIDSRLASHSNAKYISGWVKKNLKAYNNFNDLKSQLEAFVNKRMQQAPVATWGRGESCLNEMDSDDDKLLAQIVFPSDMVVPIKSTPVANIAESASERSFHMDVFNDEDDQILLDAYEAFEREDEAFGSCLTMQEETRGDADDDFKDEDDEGFGEMTKLTT